MWATDHTVRHAYVNIAAFSAGRIATGNIPSCFAMLAAMRIEIERLIREAAQRELMPRFNNVTRSFKRDGSIVTEADTATQHFLHRALVEHFGQIAFLGEEMTTSEQEALLSHAGNNLWVLDPLDGTSNLCRRHTLFLCITRLIRLVRWCLGSSRPLRDECLPLKRAKGRHSTGSPCAHR